MEFYPTDLLLHTINIVVLFLLLRLILFKPVNRFLSARKERIKSQLDDAAKKQAEAESLQQEYTKQLETIDEQGHEIIRDSMNKATQEAKMIIVDANERSDKLLSDAHEKIVKEKERAMEQMHHEVAQIATEIAARILQREVSAEDNKDIAEEFFREMREK